TLRSRALADVVARRAEAADGVRRAHVSLPAGKKRSQARVRVLLEPGAEPGPVLRRLTHGALDEARASLAPHPLAVRVRVRMGVRTVRERRAR
ncbi:alkaline shock response membrane anchor protein AmaP, partial [Streptomyces coelicoflavus]|nr:alkaline shock response membrane anchor protein AmaP [Streptomyces coelicoflavus]